MYSLFCDASVLFVYYFSLFISLFPSTDASQKLHIYIMTVPCLMASFGHELAMRYILAMRYTPGIGGNPAIIQYSKGDTP